MLIGLFTLHGDESGFSTGNLAGTIENNGPGPAPVSDLCEHLYIVLHFPCTSIRPLPVQCEYRSTCRSTIRMGVIFGVLVCCHMFCSRAMNTTAIL